MYSNHNNTFNYASADSYPLAGPSSSPAIHPPPPPPVPPESPYNPYRTQTQTTSGHTTPVPGGGGTVFNSGHYPDGNTYVTGIQHGDGGGGMDDGDPFWRRTNYLPPATAPSGSISSSAPPPVFWSHTTFNSGRPGNMHRPNSTPGGSGRGHDIGRESGGRGGMGMEVVAGRRSSAEMASGIRGDEMGGDVRGQVENLRQNITELISLLRAIYTSQPSSHPSQPPAYLLARIARLSATVHATLAALSTRVEIDVEAVREAIANALRPPITPYTSSSSSGAGIGKGKGKSTGLVGAGGQGLSEAEKEMAIIRRRRDVLIARAKEAGRIVPSPAGQRGGSVPQRSRKEGTEDFWVPPPLPSQGAENMADIADDSMGDDQGVQPGQGYTGSSSNVPGYQEGIPRNRPPNHIPPGMTSDTNLNPHSAFQPDLTPIPTSSALGLNFPAAESNMNALFYASTPAKLTAETPLPTLLPLHLRFGLNVDTTNTEGGFNLDLPMLKLKLAKGDSIDMAMKGRCHSCGVVVQGEWQEGPDGPNSLCLSCGPHYARLKQRRVEDELNDAFSITPEQRMSVALAA